MRDLVDVINPIVLGILVGFHGSEIAAAHPGEAVGDPVDMLLDRDDHVAQHRRAAGAGDDEQVGKTRAHQAEIGFGTFRPFLVERLAIAAANIDFCNRTRHGVEAGRQHQRVDFVILIPGTHGVRQYRLDRIGFDVDQRHVRTVEGGKIIGIDADAFRSDRVIVGLQQFCGVRIPDDLRDLLADEIGGGVVGGLVERQIVVDRHESEAAAGPALLIFGAALVVAVVKRAPVGHLGKNAVAGLLAGLAPDFRIVRAPGLPLLRR